MDQFMVKNTLNREKLNAVMNAVKFVKRYQVNVIYANCEFKIKYK